MSTPLRAAVIGASGIGKHHAKWFAQLGCRMDAFAGTSPESVAATKQALTDLFGFQGEGYVGLEDLFAAGPYDVVSICSPEPLHHQHLLAAVEHGAHVMCEKALVYDPELDHDRLLAMGQEMVAAARDAGVVAAVNTQYVAAVAAYYDLLAHQGIEVGPPGARKRAHSFFMQMESRGGPEGTNFEDIWLDLGSHPLSVLMAFCGPGEMVTESASCEISQKRVQATFDYRPADGPLCSAQIVCCNRPEGDLIRRLGINGLLADYEGRNDEQGIYRAYLSHEGAEIEAQDFVHTSIERFVQAARGDAEQPLATVEDGLANLATQLYLLGIGRRA
jgi:predicted dehydrogenase